MESSPEPVNEQPEEVEEEELRFKDIIDATICRGCGEETGWKYGEIEFKKPGGKVYASCNYYRCDCGFVWTDFGTNDPNDKEYNPEFVPS